jgi:hypothetical protein
VARDPAQRAEGQVDRCGGQAAGVAAVQERHGDVVVEPVPGDVLGRGVQLARDGGQAVGDGDPAGASVRS